MSNIGAILRSIDQKSMHKNLPEFNVGDGVRMKLKVVEGEKVRIHPYEGTVIRKARSGASSTFTVRKVSFGEGVERTFPTNSPVIDKLEVVSKGKVKRAKLYYLRESVGKKARVERTQAE